LFIYYQNRKQSTRQTEKHGRATKIEKEKKEKDKNIKHTPYKSNKTAAR